MRIILAFIFLGFTGLSYAQVNIGIRGGLNRSSIIFHDFKPEKKGLLRLNGGLIVEFPFDERWSLYTTPYYTGKGVRYARTPSTGKIDSITISLNYIELPVNISYSFSEMKTIRFALGAGPYLSYGFNGKIVVINSNRPPAIHLHKKETDQYKRWDLGMNANIICAINDGYGLRIDYSTSITNIHRVGKETNNVFGISFFWMIKNNNRVAD